jgi:hypothetical protein
MSGPFRLVVNLCFDRYYRDRTEGEKPFSRQLRRNAFQASDMALVDRPFCSEVADAEKLNRRLEDDKIFTELFG